MLLLLYVLPAIPISISAVAEKVFDYTAVECLVCFVSAVGSGGSPLL